MFTYIIVVAIVAVVVGIVMAVCSKRAQDVVYAGLDKAGRITNIVLVPIYAALSLSCMGIGVFCFPGYADGFLRLLGWIITLFIPLAPLFCAVGLGLSIILRKKGKRKASFIIQFLGLADLLLSFALFFICYGNLLGYIN
ncbi:MAG: hypothetical protein IKV99_04335 [Oscillospiraceae bacterium]|nr:hypothetical protein [Oscillospiraceae bacterium]